MALYFSCDFFSVSYTCKWIYITFSTNLSSLKASLVMSSLTPCYPYSTFKGEGGKFPKQVSEGDLLVEVWNVLYYKSVEYRSDLHPSSSNASDSKPSKVTPNSC
jgi:hypothetical protein